MTDNPTATRRLFIRAGVPVLILAVGIASFLIFGKYLKSQPARAESARTLPQVQVAMAQLHQAGMLIEADGVVVPYREITISAEVSGRVVERAEICRAGNFVTAGTRLAKIDPRDYELEVERLEKELQQATVALDELKEEISGLESVQEVSQKELELRARELKRIRNLAGAVTSTDLERAEANELNARNNLLTVRNRMRLLQVGRGRLEGARDLATSKLKKAKLDLQRTEILAPVDGVISDDTVEEDTYVQRGTPLLTLEDTSKVEVKCKLEMDDLYWLWDRQPASEDLPATQSAAEAYKIPKTNVQVVYCLAGHGDLEYTWEGQLARYDGIGLDEKTRTVPCRVVVDQPQSRLPRGRSGPPALLRGMYVAIRTQVQTRTPLLQVPEAAVQPGNVVWRVRNGKLQIVPVHFVTLLERTTGEDDPPPEALVYVDDSSHLEAGDRVVVSPLGYVRSGMDVLVAQDPSDSAEKE